MQRRTFLIGVGAGVGAGVGGHVTTATSTTGPDRTADPTVDIGSLDGPVGTLHGAGINGEGVSVGLLDPAGFTPEHPAIADRVVAHRTFGTVTGDHTHGTTAAVTLATVAPAASLALVGYADAADYRRGLAWLADRVDIVVVPASFYAQPDDGTGPVSRATAAATSRTPIIAAAGNLARRHWRTRLDDAGQAVEDAVRLRITEPARVRCWLTVRAGPTTPSPYQLALRPRDQKLTVAHATPYDADDTPNLRLAERVFPGTYRLVPAKPPGATVDVTAASHRLLGGDTTGSIAAPATAPGVLSVGAAIDGAVAPFSSRGGEATAVDVLGPAQVRSPPVGAFEGTSAAAAVVGGIVALARSVIDAPPDRLWRAIRRTSRATDTDATTRGGVVAPVSFIKRLGGSVEGSQT